MDWDLCSPQNWKQVTRLQKQSSVGTLCVRVMCVRERREMLETEIKDKKKETERQRGQEL